MQLTAHKTVTQFMRYVHVEDDPVRAAAETVSLHRRVVLSGQRHALEPVSEPLTEQPTNLLGEFVAMRAGFEDACCVSKANSGNYRPFRHRSGANRAVPPGTKRCKKASVGAAESYQRFESSGGGSRFRQ